MNYPYAPDGCKPGERVVFNALKRNLPDDYFVWFEPTLFGQRKSARPDFVVLGADLGMVIVEVKDWSTQGIRSANRDTFEIYSGRKVVTRSNPEHQVQSHKYALMTEVKGSRKHCARAGSPVGLSKATWISQSPPSSYARSTAPRD